MLHRCLAAFLAAWTAAYPVCARAAERADASGREAAPRDAATVDARWSGRLRGLFDSPEFAEVMRPELVGILRKVDVDDPNVLVNLARVVSALDPAQFEENTPADRKKQSEAFRAAFETHLRGGVDRPDLAAEDAERMTASAEGLARALAPREAAFADASGKPRRIKRGLTLIKQTHAERFLQMPPDRQAVLLVRAPAENRMGLIRLLPPKSAANLLRYVPAVERDALKSLIDDETRHHVNALLAYDEDQAGGHMDYRFAGLYHPEMPASEAIPYLHQLIRDGKVESIREAYLLDASHRLLGVIDYYSLLQAPPEAPVSSLARTLAAKEKLRADFDRGQIAQFFLENKVQRAPVLDADDRVVGLMMAKDVLPVLQGEWEEDFFKMVGSRAKGLLFESSFYMVRARSPWLIITFLLEFFAVGNLITYLSGGIAPELLRFLNGYIPVIAAMGGNVGAQTASAIVRGLATGEVERAGGFWTVVRKEVAVGMMLGALFGLATAAFATLVNAWLFNAHLGWHFALVVGSGMFMSMTAAAIMGSLEPFLLQRMGVDPATATGPLITTFTDLLSNAVYFTMALWLL